MQDDDEDGDPKMKELEKKKAKLKSQFDAEFDQSKDPDSGYLEKLKEEVEVQGKVSPFLAESFFTDSQDQVKQKILF